MPPLADAAARGQIREDLGTSFIVEAAAGTGKTTEIIKRVVAVLATGVAEVGRIVVVTFTNKAAGELKLRLRAELERRRQQTTDPEIRRRLDDAVTHLEEARISTIHSFCGDLLAERPVESRIDPAFRLLAEVNAEQLFSSAFQDWIEARLADAPEALRRLLRREFRGRSATQVLRADAWAFAEWRDCQARWERVPFHRAQAVDALVTQLLDFVDLVNTRPRDNIAWDVRSARSLADFIRQTERVRPRDIDELEGRFIALLGERFGFLQVRRGGSAQYAPGIQRNDLLQRHGALVQSLEQFRAAANADLAPLLQTEVFESLARYEALKDARGVLDFGDLLLRTRDLLRDNAEVRRELQERFTHLFIDEFQDTSALQAEILLLLAADDAGVASWRDVRPTMGKLFIVGDPKQSIYGFRRADMRTYRAVREQLEAAGVVALQLTTSFRALPEIQRFVNAAFEPEMQGDLQPTYVALSPYRTHETSQPSVIALPIPKPYGKDDVTKTAIRSSLPDAVGAFVSWLVTESGWKVRERGALVDVAARHVCLLFRNFKNYDDDLTRPYVSALEARDIPHIVVGGRSLHAREEIETLRAALAAIEYPDDELALYATLRGALFSFTDAELLEYRTAHGLVYIHIPGDVAEALRPIRDVLEFLRSLHRLRNARPVADTVMRLIEFTRSFANFVFRPSGEQVLANVLLIDELARAYDGSDALSFRGFVQQLEVHAERNQAAEAPTLEEGTDGVRMMTAFKAKGLEFPVVIIADICPNRRGESASRYVDAEACLHARPIAGCAPRELLANDSASLDADEAEVVRLAYVAATRAQDLLVIPVVGDAPYTDGWLDPINRAIYPGEQSVRLDPQPEFAVGFGETSTVERPQGVAATSVRPGAYRFGDAASGYTVVWWDPRSLDLEKEPRFGLRQETLLASDGDPLAVQTGVDAFRYWATRRDAAINEGRTPTLEAQRVTRLRDGIDLELPAIARIDVPGAEEDRPFGPAFGTLVHAILAAVPLSGGRAEIDAVATLCGRILAADDTAITAAASAVEAALAHPLLRRAAAAEARGACKRETPVTLTHAGGLLEGVVDLAFEEGGEWIVVDFKTDTDLDLHEDEYHQQIGIYVTAIERAMHAPTRGILLRV